MGRMAPVVVAGLLLPQAPAAPLPRRDHRIERVYRGGVGFPAFLDAARKRAAEWRRIYDDAEVPEPLVRRAAAVGGTWRLLAISADWCGDSVHTVPYVARLAEAVPGLELRLVDRDAGQPLLESRRTPDGRTATPTVILLDAAQRDAGCWIERPSRLQTWVLGHKAVLAHDDLYAGRDAWYDEDGGRETLREIVEMIEAAAAGHPRCGSPPEAKPR
jgi:Thioredoxin